MSIHLVYPVDFKKKSAPWTIGNNLYNELKKIDDVKIYQWTSFEKILPQKGDVLIGHAHPNPFTTFRRSLLNSNWKEKILIQPFNSDPLQMSYLNECIDHCDIFFAIMGRYWFDNLNKSIFKSWKKKMIRLDMAIDINNYKKIKYKFNKKNNRKFIYIGNEIRFNNFTKNTQYLMDIANNSTKNLFATAGNKKLDKIKHYGWLNFQKSNARKILKEYDFLIMTSRHDANPTVILEAMSWGLIPVVTKECGYYKEKGIFNFPLDNLKIALKLIKKLQNINSSKLRKIQLSNFLYVKEAYTWDNFTDKIVNYIKKNKKKKFYNLKLSSDKIKSYYKHSPNYHLGLSNIFSFILVSAKFFCKSLFNEKN